MNPWLHTYDVFFFNSNLRKSTFSVSLGHVPEVSDYCVQNGVVQPWLLEKEKNWPSVEWEREAKMRPRCSLSHSVLSIMKNIFPVPQVHPLENSPTVQATHATWGSAEGSHPSTYQAIIQTANPPLWERARIVTQVEWNTTKLQQRKNLDAI